MSFWLSIEQRKGDKTFLVDINPTQVSYVQRWKHVNELGSNVGVGQIIVASSVFTIWTPEDREKVEKALNLSPLGSK